MIKHLQTHLLGLGTLSIVFCLLTGNALGQALPRSIVTGADATTPASRAEIDTFVKDLVAKVVTNADQAARESLISPVTSSGASTSFLDVFATTINREVTGQGLGTNQDVRVRLNLAIVVARVANKSNSIKLEPAAEIFVKDKSEPVALWGIKAMIDIVPAMLAIGQNPQSAAAAVIDAVKLHTASDFIPEDAYRALMPGSSRLGSVTAPTLRQYMQFPIDLLDYRANLYAAAVPPDPSAEPIASNFLVQSKTWSAQTKAQQAKVVHLLIVVLKGAASQFGNRQGEVRDVVSKVGAALQIVGDNEKDANIQTKALPLARVQSNASQASIDTWVKDLEDAVTAHYPEPKALVRP